MNNEQNASFWEKAVIVMMAVLFIIPPGLAQTLRNKGGRPVKKEHTEPLRGDSLSNDSTVYADLELAVPVAPVDSVAADSIPPTEVTADGYLFDESGHIPFNPDPTRAVWMSALFPGLGQIYNRRYWKLPIVVGGFMGLGYATNWNAGQYNDYMQGYRDLMDSDPGTKSYMNFFPPTVSEGDLDKAWLERVFKSKKDYFRRNRDLCIICLVALYLVCMVDAYVDAQMAHFDISPDLSVDFAPAVINSATSGWRRPSYGLQWTLTF